MVVCTETTINFLYYVPTDHTVTTDKTGCEFTKLSAGAQRTLLITTQYYHGHCPYFLVPSFKMFALKHHGPAVPSFHTAPPQIKFLQQGFCYLTTIHLWKELERARVFTEMGLPWYVRETETFHRHAWMREVKIHSTYSFDRLWIISPQRSTTNQPVWLCWLKMSICSSTNPHFLTCN